MLKVALLAERKAYLDKHCDLTDEKGKRLVVGNGFHKERGMESPCIAIGDGALGFWAALRDVYPKCTQQLCWVHKTRNVLSALPKRLHDEARVDIRSIWRSDTRAGALDNYKLFREKYKNYDKAVKSIGNNLDCLLSFYSFPNEHWMHLRTTNPIESTFSPLKARTRVTRGAGSSKAALVMCFKLLEVAQERWQRIHAADLLSHVDLGHRFIDGQLRDKMRKGQEQTSDDSLRKGKVAA